MNQKIPAPKAENPKKKSSPIMSFIKARNTKKGAVSITVTVLFIAAVILVNVIVGALSSRFTLYADLTQNATFMLQDQTVEYIEKLPSHVDIYVLENEIDFEESDSTNYEYFVQANKLLHQFEQKSDNISLHYVDLTSDPTFTAAYPNIDWTQGHMMLVVSDDRYRAIDATDIFEYDTEQYYYYGYYIVESQHVEQAVTTAILNVTTAEKVTVTVLSGQGEQDMSAFVTLLENNAYNVETVSLINGTISEDSEYVIIYAPDVDIDEDAYDTLSAWLYNDGRYEHNLIYYPSDQHDVAEYTNLNTLISEYGMAVRYGYISETDSNHIVSSEYGMFLYDYVDEEFTEDLRNPDIPVVMLYTMPVEITDDEVASALLISSENAYLLPMTGADEDFVPEMQQLVGAAIGTKTGSGEEGGSSNVIVIGSYDAMASSFLSASSFNNAAYFVNLFNVLSHKNDISVIIEGKDPNSTELGYTTQNSILFPAILVRYVIPAAVLLAGIIIWIRRRHR